LSERQRRWVVLVAAVLGALGTARLGWWQLSRAAEKRALQQAIEQRGRLPPLQPAQLARTAAEGVGQHHRTVRLTGQWLAQHTLYLDNRQMRGRPGFFVLTPLALADGSAVLVQRGWVPRNVRAREQLSPVVTPAGEVQLLGRVAPGPARLYEFAPSASGVIRQNVELSALASETGLALRPVSVLQLDTGSAPDGLLRDWPAPAVDVSKHHGYAFQWFALSALIVGLYVWFQLLRPRRSARSA